MATRRERCQQWSDEHSHAEISEFDPEVIWEIDGLNEQMYINAYYNAYVRDYKPSELKEFKANFRYYLVDVMEYVTDAEFDELYFTAD